MKKGYIGVIRVSQTFTSILVACHSMSTVYASMLHSVDLLKIFYLLDFTWNQFERNLKKSKIAFWTISEALHFNSSEFSQLFNSEFHQNQNSELRKIPKQQFLSPSKLLWFISRKIVLAEKFYIFHTVCWRSSICWQVYLPAPKVAKWKVGLGLDQPNEFSAATLASYRVAGFKLVNAYFPDQL